MKYIKEYNNYNINQYKEISEGESISLLNTSKGIDFTDKEYNDIKLLFNNTEDKKSQLPYIVSYVNNNRNLEIEGHEFILCNREYIKNDASYFIEVFIEDNEELAVQLIKLNDEYFFVSLLEESVMGFTYIYFKCDQIDGLFNCIKHIKKLISEVINN